MIKPLKTLVYDTGELADRIANEIGDAIKAPSHITPRMKAKKYFLYPIVDWMIDYRLSYTRSTAHPRQYISEYLNEHYVPPTTLPVNLKSTDILHWIDQLVAYYQLPEVTEDLQQDICDLLFDRYFSALHEDILGLIGDDTWLIYKVSYLGDLLVINKTREDFRINYFNEHFKHKFRAR